MSTKKRNLTVLLGMASALTFVVAQPGQAGTLQAAAAAPTVNCPSVAGQVGNVPAAAQAEVNQNLALLDTQIKEANQRLASTVGQGGPNFIQNAILGPLADKRTATLNRIATAIGRTGQQKPVGLAGLAQCTLNGAAAGNAGGGNAGQNGQNGQNNNGQAGQNGQNGQNGQAGQNGQNGQNNNGQNGQNGNGQGAGKNGATGPVDSDFIDIRQVPPKAGGATKAATTGARTGGNGFRFRGNRQQNRAGQQAGQQRNGQQQKGQQQKGQNAGRQQNGQQQKGQNAGQQQNGQNQNQNGQNAGQQQNGQNAAAGKPSTGTFTDACGNNQNGHRNPDNFIVTPGVSNGAQHTHDYVGNLSTTGFSTDQSLLAAGTTCANGDKSTFFWPVLRDQSKGGDGGDGNIGQILTPQVKIQFRGNAKSQVRAMPQFLRVITGDAKTLTNGPANARAQWTCTGFENRLTDKYPLCPAGSKVVRVLDFPSCLQGNSTDSANHRTHILFPDGSGACPAGTSPVPQLRYTLTYSIANPRNMAVDTFPNQNHSPVTDHADFTNVAPAQLENKIVNCINSGQNC